MRGRWVFDRSTGRLVDAAEFYARRAEAVPSSSLPRPSVVTDHIEVRSMVDGKTYTNKAALRASYRAHGYIEVGNEPLKPKPKSKPDRKGIRDSVERAFARAGIN